MHDAAVDIDEGHRFEATYRENGARLWRSVLLYSGDREVASDAVAEAFAQAIHRGEQVRDPLAGVTRAAFPDRCWRAESETGYGAPGRRGNLWHA